VVLRKPYLVMTSCCNPECCLALSAESRDFCLRFVGARIGLWLLISRFGNKGGREEALPQQHNVPFLPTPLAGN